MRPLLYLRTAPARHRHLRGIDRRRDWADRMHAAAPHPATPTAVTQRGRGRRHFLLVPGLVPDGPETYWRQMQLFRSFGWTTVYTYPYQTFDTGAVVEAIARFAHEARAAGRTPVLVGCSIGGGMVLEALRRARAAGEALPVGGVILVSPFSCMDDLAPLLRRLLKPILDEADKTDGKPDAPFERGRAFFKSLAARALAEGKAKDAARARSAWRSWLGRLTPQGMYDLREAAVRQRIERTLDAIPQEGGMARVCELRRFPGIDHGAHADKPLTTAPALILWGSKERQTLSMEGPGTSVLCRPDLAWRWLPSCEIHWVYDTDGGDVPHASLLKHARPFNVHLRRWLARTQPA
jgi:hypothetical protein